MEKKSNESTPQRPQGDRLLNAPLVQMDLNTFIDQIKAEETWKTSDRNSITLFKSKSMRIVLMGMHANTTLKTHDTKAYISIQVLIGELDFITDEETTAMKGGGMVALQPKIPHSINSKSDSFFILTFAF